ncbi:hypothetical protein COO60DRAFT_1515211, partial [Scenedesmus sp. NREL 46B-D3]
PAALSPAASCWHAAAAAAAAAAASSVACSCSSCLRSASNASRRAQVKSLTAHISRRCALLTSAACHAWRQCSPGGCWYNSICRSFTAWLQCCAAAWGVSRIMRLCILLSSAAGAITDSGSMRSSCATLGQDTPCSCCCMSFSNNLRCCAQQMGCFGGFELHLQLR